MELRCNWRGNKVLNVDCQGDQMLVTYGGKQGNVHVCQAHADALRSISPGSGAKFSKPKPTEERE